MHRAHPHHRPGGALRGRRVRAGAGAHAGGWGPGRRRQGAGYRRGHGPDPRLLRGAGDGERGGGGVRARTGPGDRRRARGGRPCAVPRQGVGAKPGGDGRTLSMTPSNPEGAENRDPLPLTPPPQAPDPWGVKRAENLITSLTGVLSARVVVTPLGEVSEIHVLTSSDQQAKQVVRNIESALMAQLGLKIDHRKISVAQTADVRPIEQLQEEAVRTRAKRRVVVFQGLEVRPSDRPQRVLVRVKLSFEGKDAEAEEQGTDTVRNRVEAAARAASLCLEELLADNFVALEGAQIIDAFDRKFVFVAVHGLGGREAQLLTGTAEIRESAERSAVLAVLDATNRWADARR